MCWYTTQHRLEWVRTPTGWIYKSFRTIPTATLILAKVTGLCIQLFLSAKVMNSQFIIDPKGYDGTVGDDTDVEIHN